MPRELDYKQAFPNILCASAQCPDEERHKFRDEYAKLNRDGKGLLYTALRPGRCEEELCATLQSWCDRCETCYDAYEFPKNILHSMQLHTASQLCNRGLEAGHDFTMFADQIRIHDGALHEEELGVIMSKSAEAYLGVPMDVHTKSVEYTDAQRARLVTKDFRTCAAILAAHQNQTMPSAHDTAVSWRRYAEL